MASRLPTHLTNCLEGGLEGFDAVLVDQDGGRHPVSKPILASNSKFFLALFSSTPDQQQSIFPITIPAVNCNNVSKSLSSALAWVTGKMKLKEDNVVDIVIVADYLQLLELRGHCQQVRDLRIFVSEATK